MRTTTSSSRNRPPRRKEKVCSKARPEAKEAAAPLPQAQAAEDAAQAEVREWLGRAAASFQAVDPVRMNHAFLELMREVSSACGLSPRAVQQRTDLTHQHQRKLLPTADMLGETRVTFCTLLRWSNGMGLNPLSVVERLLKKAASFLLVLSPAAA